MPVKKNILITGVTGFAGSHLVDLLSKDSTIKIYGLDRSPEKLRNFGGTEKQIEFLEGNILDVPTLHRLLSQVSFEAIYHLAGQSSPQRSFQKPQETLNVNLVGAINLLEAVRTSSLAKTTCVLLVTSGEVYGAVSEGELPVTEQTPMRPTHPYGFSKMCVHYAGQYYARTYGLQIVEARSFNHIGPRQSLDFVVPDFAKQLAEIALKKREPIMKVGDLSAERDFTDVRDVVRAYILLAARGKAGNAYHICSGKSVSIQRVLSLLLECANVKVEVQVDSAKLRPSKTSKIYGSNEKIMSELGWRPQIPLEESLYDTFQYWLEITKRK